MKSPRIFCIVLSILCCSQQLTAQTAVSKAKATLNHVAVFVVDLEKTKSFYGGLFQLDTIPEPFHDGKHAWYSIAPGVALHVIQGADKPKEYFLNNHICFSVPNTEAFVAQLRNRNIGWFNAKGVKGEITTRVDGVKQIWVNDPDGYWIEVNDAKN
ncbi:MAG: VOC family protein [Bacteroidota bacterium]